MTISHFNLPFDHFLLHAGLFAAKDGNNYYFYVCWDIAFHDLVLFVEVPGHEFQQGLVCKLADPRFYMNHYSKIINILELTYNAVRLW